MKWLNVTSKLILVSALGFVLAGGTCASSQPAATTETTTQEREQTVIVGSEVPGAPSLFTVSGTNTDFGRYLAVGELNFVDSQEAGVLREGAGVGVLRDQNGDQIVADVTCKVSQDGIDFTFHWRDSVVFTNGSTPTNTGAFVANRPPGLVLSRTRLSAVFIDGICCIDCCTSGGSCTNQCTFCGISQVCPDGSTKTR